MRVNSGAEGEVAGDPPLTGKNEDDTLRAAQSAGHGRQRMAAMRTRCFHGVRGLPVVLVLAAATYLAGLPAAAPVPTAHAFEPFWVQTHSPTQLWSGPDAGAVSFGPVPQWSYFLVVAPQTGPRLYVKNQLTNNHAYLDASAVGPSPPPRLGVQTAPGPSGLAGVVRTPPRSTSGEPFWVANWLPTEFRSGPEPWAYGFRPLPQFRRMLVIAPQSGSRLKVWSPEWDLVGYVDAETVGPVGPSVWMQSHPIRLTRQLGVPGRSVGQTSYVRNLPVRADETELRQVPNNTPLQVLAEGTANDGSRWYVVGDGEYIPASEVRVPPPLTSTIPGRWIDIELREPAILTAYEDGRIVHTALAIKGTIANPTLKGSYRIWRRVENETMDSATVGIPRNAPDGYYLKDVLYTQYFTYGGAAIHYNYWLGTFGYPGSHGCLGLNLEDSKWLWEWAGIGTPVIVR